MSSDRPPGSPFDPIPLRSRTGRSSSNSPEPRGGLIDLRGRHWRPANIEDHVPRLLLRGIHTECHLSPPLLVDPPHDGAQPLEVLLGEMHDSEIQIELIFRRLAPVKPQRNRSVEFVIERLESTEHFSEEFVSRKGLHRVEGRRWLGGHGTATGTSQINMRRVECLDHQGRDSPTPAKGFDSRAMLALSGDPGSARGPNGLQAAVSWTASSMSFTNPGASWV